MPIYFKKFDRLTNKPRYRSSDFWSLKNQNASEVSIKLINVTKLFDVVNNLLDTLKRDMKVKL